MTHFTAPAHDMNMTPLIDVLLVLLVMFVITIPAATHSVDIELPRDCPRCELPALETNLNKVTIDRADRLLWNGQLASREELAALLQLSRRLPVEPELQFEPSARASYEVSSRTLAAIKASGVTRFGFVGNERYRNFGE